jgi:hypothetical protein
VRRVAMQVPHRRVHRPQPREAAGKKGRRRETRQPDNLFRTTLANQRSQAAAEKSTRHSRSPDIMERGGIPQQRSDCKG